MKIVYCSKCGSKIGEFPDSYYQKRVCLDCKKKRRYELQLQWIKDNKEWIKKYRGQHIDKWNANRRKNYAKNKQEERRKRNIWNEKNIELVKMYKKRSRQKKRLSCLTHYGGDPPKCQCCGETEYGFLTIDHINNDGNEHRKQIKIDCIYGWLIKNNFPEGFQVLCYNCNLGKAQNNGICPHKNRNVY